MAEPHGLVHRVLARKNQRRNAPLRLELVEQAQPPAQGLLLPAPLQLEPADLPLQARDVGLRLLDPRVEGGDLPALFGEALLGVLQLDEDGGFPLLGLGDLRPLLGELPLLLLQGPLAVAEVGRLTPALRAGRAREQQPREQPAQSARRPRDHE